MRSYKPFCHSRMLLSGILTFIFLTNAIGPLPQAQADEFRLPAPGVMVHLSHEFNPPILKGIKVHPENPFKFDFILDKGDSQLSNDALKDESSKLIKYFLASLTIPEKDLWVNLSPYEKDRIVPEFFGQTEMGRDLLAEDYMLKQITASLIYPEGETGKKFWKRIYEEAEKKFGTTSIPVNTFNKVWIVPEKAVVYENVKIGAAYVVESKLKVMLEQDYLSLAKHEGIQSSQAAIKGTSQLGSQVVREIIIPELDREVNEGKNFAQLRQVYNSLILATWYKKKIKDSILEQVYAGKNKVVGVNIDDPKENQKIYEQYLQAFKKGVYNYIKEDLDLLSQQRVPRKYFSGGEIFAWTDKAMSIKDQISPERLGNTNNLYDVSSSVGEAAYKNKDQAMTNKEEFESIVVALKLIDHGGPLDIKAVMLAVNIITSADHEAESIAPQLQGLMKVYRESLDTAENIRQEGDWDNEYEAIGELKIKVVDLYNQFLDFIDKMASFPRDPLNESRSWGSSMEVLSRYKEINFPVAIAILNGSSALEPINLKDFLSELVQSARTRFDDIKQPIEGGDRIDSTLSVEANRQLLFVSMERIIENAYQAINLQGINKLIEIRVEKSVDNRIHIQIINIGRLNSELSFKPDLDSEMDDTRDAGIGLSFSRIALGIMGGAISSRNIEENGQNKVMFDIELKLANQAVENRAMKARVPQNIYDQQNSIAINREIQKAADRINLALESGKGIKDFNLIGTITDSDGYRMPIYEIFPGVRIIEKTFSRINIVDSQDSIKLPGAYKAIKKLQEFRRPGLVPIFFLPGDYRHYYEFDLRPFGYTPLVSVLEQDFEFLDLNRTLISRAVENTFRFDNSLWFAQGHLHAGNILLKIGGNGEIEDIKFIDMEQLSPISPVSMHLMQVLAAGHALSEVERKQVRIYPLKFEWWNLRGRDFSNLYMWGDFHGSDLTGAKFVGSKLDNVDLFMTKLENVDFTDADIFSANFPGADVLGANFQGVRADIRSLIGVRNILRATPDRIPKWIKMLGMERNERAREIINTIFSGLTEAPDNHAMMAGDRAMIGQGSRIRLRVRYESKVRELIKSTRFEIIGDGNNDEVYGVSDPKSPLFGFVIKVPHVYKLKDLVSIKASMGGIFPAFNSVNNVVVNGKHFPFVVIQKRLKVFEDDAVEIGKYTLPNGRIIDLPELEKDLFLKMIDRGIEYGDSLSYFNQGLDETTGELYMVDFGNATRVVRQSIEFEHTFTRVINPQDRWRKTETKWEFWYDKNIAYTDHDNESYFDQIGLPDDDELYSRWGTRLSSEDNPPVPDVELPEEMATANTITTDTSEIEEIYQIFSRLLKEDQRGMPSLKKTYNSLKILSTNQKNMIAAVSAAVGGIFLVGSQAIIIKNHLPFAYGLLTLFFGGGVLEAAYLFKNSTGGYVFPFPGSPVVIVDADKYEKGVTTAIIIHELAHFFNMPNNGLYANSYRYLIGKMLGPETDITWGGSERRVIDIANMIFEEFPGSFADQEAMLRKFIYIERGGQFEEGSDLRKVLKSIKLSDKDYNIPHIYFESESSWAYLYGTAVAELALRHYGKNDIYSALRLIYRLGKLKNSKLAQIDNAMNAGETRKIVRSNTGGIDLTPASNLLQTQNDGIGIKFHISPAQLAQLQNAPGLTVGSITILPLKSLSAFLGLSGNQSIHQVIPQS